MKISVLVPAINEAEQVGRCIASASLAGADQIILCDGGSHDRTLECAIEHGADQCVDSAPGRGIQLAAGLQKANGDVVVILHADNSLGQNSLLMLRQHCGKNIQSSAGPSTIWGGFRQDINGSQAIYRWLERGNAARVRIRGMVFGDQAMFFHRDMIDRIGGIPEVPLMEDVLMSRKFRKIRWPVLLPGRVNVSSRRWERRGVISQTWMNWRIQLAHKFGADEHELSRRYQSKRH